MLQESSLRLICSMMMSLVTARYVLGGSRAKCASLGGIEPSEATGHRVPPCLPSRMRGIVSEQRASTLSFWAGPRRRSK